MLFETKKIQRETLSEYLKEIRESLQLSVDQVSEQTNIQPKFIKALETDDLSALPADVYVLGFLRQLAQRYAVDATQLIEQYKKERSIKRQLEKKTRFDALATKNFFGSVAITPKIISIVAGIIFVAVTLIYIAWQISAINKTPSLNIFQPHDRQIIDSSSVEVSGKTEPGITLTINNQNVYVDSMGNFKTQISLGNGPQNLIFVATNSFQKNATKTITIIGDSPVVNQTASSTQGVRLELQFSGIGVLTYSLDSAAPQTLNFNPGDAKGLQANGEIVITTTNAGATTAVYNGQDLGVLGKPGQTLQNVPFSAESGILPTATSTP